MAARTPDEAAMSRAIRLSRRGFPAPNPHVGCVLVRDGEVVGEGWHAAAGMPHAEAVALAKAGEKSRGSTAYVTLEPCNHTGRTAPCSQALIRAGVKRVVVANFDPNPKAKGGIQTLTEAGIEVQTGLLATEAAEENWRFLTAHRLGRPAVVAKCALSADGRIALPSGESQWITSSESRRQGHRLRAEMGAVLVGRATVEKDNPALTARIPGVRNQPLRIVLDPTGKLTAAPTKYKVFDHSAETLHVTTEGFPLEKGAIDLEALLSVLFARGVTGLLVEGGAVTIGKFLDADLVDRLELFLAPKILGDGLSAIRCVAPEHLDLSRTGRWTKIRRYGPDLGLRLDLHPETLEPLNRSYK